MDDNDAKMSAAPKGRASKPGAISEGASFKNRLDQENLAVEVSGNVTATDGVKTMSQREHDALAKQQGANTTIDGQMKPGAVSVGVVKDAPNSDIPGDTQDAPSSRLAAKLRGERPDNWDAGSPALATLESREDKIEGKIRDAGPQVNSKLLDRENQVQGKIRSSENTTSVAMPGALARLSNLEDAVTSKQDNDDDLLATGTSTPTQLQQREDLAATKSAQVTHNLDEAPQRLQQVESMLDVKMRNGSAEDTNRASKIAGNEIMEYGEYGGPTEGDLAVALAVDEEEGADPYMPAAVEYDPDAKPPLYRSRRFRMYTCLALIAVIIGIVGAVLGILLTVEDDEVVPPDIQYRETLGIRENIELVVGRNEMLDDVSSPYRKALDWIIFSDPMSLTPDSNKLAQRYIAAYIYYSTSAKKPWTSDCSPPEEGDRDMCSYEYFQPYGALGKQQAMRWLSNSDECKWAGIKCDDTFQIREIDMTGTDLTGAFPEGILMLPFLQSVRFAHGEIEGPLPVILADAKHLVKISLENNTITGTFPDRWLESRSFQILELFDNNITGTISPNLTKLKDLKVFNLHQNSLEGSIPEEIGDVSNLVNLDVDQNILTGTIPTQLGSLTNIEVAHLGRNKLTGTIPTEIGLMALLFSVRLHVNLLTGTVPESFWNSDKIFLVDLFENMLNGTVSTEIGRLTSLSEIRINNNQFSGSLPPRIASGSANLRQIVASGNKLNGTVSSRICEERQNIASFVTLELDCKVPIGGNTSEIICPESCCTLCCDSNGLNCITG